MPSVIVMPGDSVHVNPVDAELLGKPREPVAELAPRGQPEAAALNAGAVSIDAEGLKGDRPTYSRPWRRSSTLRPTTVLAGSAERIASRREEGKRIYRTPMLGALALTPKTGGIYRRIYRDAFLVKNSLLSNEYWRRRSPPT